MLLISRRYLSVFSAISMFLVLHFFQCKFQFYQKVGKGRHVYVRAWPRPSRSAWAETLQTHGFPVQTYGKLQSAVTLILRCESKFLKVKSLHSIHSARRCKNYVPKCSQFPPELIN